MANASNTTSSAFPGLPRDPQIPKNIAEQDLLSRTSVAAECFVYQRMSGRLQAYLVDYVSKIYSDYSLYH